MASTKTTDELGILGRIRYDAGYYIACEGLSPIAGYWEAIKDFFKYRVFILLCKLIGHKWIDNSHAGPESGTIEMYCDRCGESHRTILY